jgi:hypothetical protein
LSSLSPITIARSAPITDAVLSYDGIQQFAAEPNPLLPPLGAFSIEAWFRIDGIPGTTWNQTGTLWANDDDSFAITFEAISHSQPPQISAQVTLNFGASKIKFATLFSLGQWYYIVITVDTVAGKATLYVNASLIDIPVGVPTGAITFGPARVGTAKQITNAFFQGAIGTIRIWQGMLGLPNIQQLMYQTLSGTVEARDSTGQVIATLRMNWRCDEGYGNFAFDYSGPSLDLSLGDGVLAATKPVWQVSTILKPPDFVDVVPPMPQTISFLARYETGDLSIRVFPPPVFALPVVPSEGELHERDEKAESSAHKERGHTPKKKE